MATTSPTRIDDDLYASAKAVGAVMSRSASQQIAHWARIGRELETSASVSPRDVARVLEGGAAYDTLNPHEQAIVRTAWVERSADRLAELDFDRELTDAGVAFSELDDEGSVVRRQPPTEA